MNHGYMASNKGATGPICETAQDAANAYFARYSRTRECVTHYVSVVPGPCADLVRVDYRQQRIKWIRNGKVAVNANN